MDCRWARLHPRVPDVVLVRQVRGPIGLRLGYATEFRTKGSKASFEEQVFDSKSLGVPETQTEFSTLFVAAGALVSSLSLLPTGPLPLLPLLVGPDPGEVIF